MAAGEVQQTAETSPPIDGVGDPQTEALQPTSAKEPDKAKETLKWRIALYNRGLLEVLVGFTMVVLGFVTLDIVSLNRTYTTESSYRTVRTYDHESSYRGAGIWGGSYLVILGVLGVTLKLNPSYKVTNANQVLSFFGMFALLASGILSAIAASNMNNQYPIIIGLVVIHGFLSGFGFIGAMLCFSHVKMMCCHAPPDLNSPA